MFEYCLPVYDDLSTSQQAGFEAMMAEFSASFFGSYANDVYKARWVILTSIAIGIVFTFIYITLMRYFASTLAWVSVGLVQLGLIMMGFFFWNERRTTDEQSTGLWWAMFFAWLSAGIFYCFLACNWSSLQVSVAVIKVTSDWVADTKRLIFMPVATLFMGLIVFVIWTAGLACVASTSVDPIVANAPGSGDQAKVLVWTTFTYVQIYMMLFGGVWLAFFLISFNEYVTIVAAISWYFSDKTIPDDDGIPGDSEVYLGFKWGLCYQLGSLAAGSLILAVAWIVTTILKFVSKRVENATGNNCCTKCLIGCIMCFVDCFNRFVRYLTQNAYICMALQNESFCMASVHAFILMLKNAAKFSMVSTIASVFMFIAKICIAVSTTWVGFLILEPMLPKGTELSEPLAPVLVIFLFAYMISSVFIGVFDAGCNTILQCYLMD